MEISVLVEQMIQNGAFQRVVNNPLAQFGVPTRNYLGASLLPEKPVQFNRFVEEGIRYRTVVANAATRYSPVQIKGGVMTGSFEVALGDSDIGSHFTGEDYDALVRAVQNYTGGTANESMGGMTQMIRWSDKTLNLPLVEFNEVQRWQALVDASVVRRGDNGYEEVVALSSPGGHRRVAGGQWSNDAYDPYPDIINVVEFLRGKGYNVTRIITSTSVEAKLANNLKMQTRIGRLSIIAGTVVGLPGRATRADLANYFAQDGIPPLEKYDLQYQTQTSSGFFLRRDAMVFICATGRDQSIDRGDLEPIIIPDTLGYSAVGRPVGQIGPGRVVKIRSIDDSKPPRIEGESWQTSFPVIAEPEAVAVITGIN